MAINLFGFVLSRYELNATETNHEYIHSLQQRELLWIFFYLFYSLEWLAKLFYTEAPRRPTLTCRLNGRPMPINPTSFITKAADGTHGSLIYTNQTIRNSYFNSYTKKIRPTTPLLIAPPR